MALRLSPHSTILGTPATVSCEQNHVAWEPNPTTRNNHFNQLVDSRLNLYRGVFPHQLQLCNTA
ncbi:hypothetical protein BO70DRAFT_58580 [Aspergillus heteromorphus CBS 117.55]|uniref:Uncharacterized protein n=1 Tax=Aspergillus heteromorphus CBS 117.55 TaxID=1448321 RepID=A0A317W071_9EURO|nr:uncharacterized protein BO70DRAFT_58580 [Aspergillus heteromorphus CBS 117.55]PWY79299.1 hypothetical protein BO70DRAFT_58580 [Aspergillus heteromorphus CBS 117.55]